MRAKYKNHEFGAKLLNELMVDIIGGLIPGLLFIVVLIISIVIPCILYGFFEGLNVWRIDNSVWWVLLIVCIIFSYVVGHIFYRAQIVLPDQKNVDKLVKTHIKNTLKKYKYGKGVEELLEREIKVLQARFDVCIEGNQWNKLNIIIPKACGNVIDKLKNRDTIDLWESDILIILFPEETRFSDEKLVYDKLSQHAKEVIEKYERFISARKIPNKYNRYLMIYYCILYNQMDLGCAIKERCEFPYTNYYKYLLKRNLTHLLKHVNWFNIEDRTKNQINSLKIKIQLFANEAYAPINKNESHIRMSSSTWHISKLLLVITGFTSFVMLILLVCSDNDLNQQLSIHSRITTFLLPFSMFLFVFYKKHLYLH